MNTREIAVFILSQILENKAYNNILIKKTFDKNLSLSKTEKAFITEIVNGTLRNIIFIDYIINQFSTVKTTKMKSFILNILRISVYQIKFMDKVPISAICNEAVKLTKNKKFVNLASFVNAVLRNIARNIDNIKLPDKNTEKLKYLKVLYSMPDWIIEMWSEQYDFNEIEKICKSNLISPKVCICINTNKIDKQVLEKELKKEKINFEDANFIENALYISKTNNISETSVFKNGFFHVMDESSMLSVEIASVSSFKTVIDVCSSPGGKAFYCAYKMQDKGEIICGDIYEHKIKLIDQSVERLGLKSIKTHIADALKFDKQLEKKADIVIIDAPCSGFGILRKKPDIKYTRTKEDITQLVNIQRQILQNCCQYVKDDGYIIYSTCTISKAENIDNINWFCKNFNYKLEDLNLDLRFKELDVFDTSSKGYLQILPYIKNTDGFFIAKLKRKGFEK